MIDRKRERAVDKVIHRVMKTVDKFDHIGKSEFETILHKIMLQVEKNTDADPDRIAEVTPKILEDMPNEYGHLSDDARSWEALISYFYTKYLKELGCLE